MIAPASHLEGTAAFELGSIARIDISQISAPVQIFATIYLFHVDKATAFVAQVGHQHLHGIEVLIEAGALQHVIEVIAERCIK